MAFQQVSVFGKTFCPCFCNNQVWDVKEEKVQMGVQSRRGRVQIRMAGVTSMHPSTPRAQLGPPRSHCRGRTDIHISLCEAPLKCHSLGLIGTLLLVQRDPAPALPCKALSPHHNHLYSLTLHLCCSPCRVVSPVPGTWEVANKCWANELSRKTKPQVPE